MLLVWFGGFVCLGLAVPTTDLAASQPMSFALLGLVSSSVFSRSRELSAIILSRTFGGIYLSQTVVGPFHLENAVNITITVTGVPVMVQRK